LVNILRSGKGKLSFSQNSLMNLATQVAISGLAVVALPAIVHGLGDERFGLLSLCWLMLGYVGFLDLGLGQATVNLLAGRIADGRMAEAGGILRTSLLVGTGLSVAFIVLFEVLHEMGLASFLNLSPALAAESKSALRIFALGIPPVLLTGVLRSVPLSMNRFDLVNLLQTIGALLQWLGSIAVIALGGGLVEVIALFVGTRYLIVAALYLFVRSVFPSRAGAVPAPAGEATYLRRLLAFGGWISVAQILGPLLLVFERVIITRVSSPEWITYFAVPQDTLLKLVIVPMSLASTLYPVVSARWHQPEGAAFSRRIYHDAVRYAYYVLLPAVFIAIAFSGEILGLWLGETFAERSGDVFALVALGVLFHALAQLPNTIILGSGRPQITAKLLLVEIVPYLALAVWFTSMWGVRGTALAWLIRVVVETAYLFIRVRAFWDGADDAVAWSYIWKGAVLLVCCGAPVLVARFAGLGTAADIGAAVAFAAAYSASLWFLLFNDDDRARLLGVFRPARPAA
jgi:O-antigen/teichoic acid export membrane protein